MQLFNNNIKYSMGVGGTRNLSTEKNLTEDPKGNSNICTKNAELSKKVHTKSLQMYRGLVKTKLELFSATHKPKTCRNFIKQKFESIVSKIPDTPEILDISDIADMRNRDRYTHTEIAQFFLQYFPTELTEHFYENYTGGDFYISGNLECMNDLIRTKLFFKAIHRSLEKLDQEKDTIHVTDAGCGGFPIMGIYAALYSKKVKCICIERNPYLVDIARGIVKNMKLEDQITIIHDDATTYTSPHSIDLLISETMNTALCNEPIAQIMENLTPQVTSNGIVLPSQVNIKASIFTADFLALHRQRVFLSVTDSYYLSNATWQDVFTYNTRKKINEVVFQLSTENLDSREKYIPMLGCSVDLEDITIPLGFSQITRPCRIYGMNASFAITENTRNKLLTISYKPGAEIINAHFIKDTIEQ